MIAGPPDKMIEVTEIQTVAGVTAPVARKAWWAVVARFLVHGLITATWVSRIPAIKEGLHLNNGAFGLALLGSAIGSLFAIPMCGWMVNRYGSSRVTTWTSIGFCLS